MGYVSKLKANIHSRKFQPVRYGTVRYGTVRYGTVRYGAFSFALSWPLSVKRVFYKDPLRLFKDHTKIIEYLQRCLRE